MICFDLHFFGLFVLTNIVIQDETCVDIVTGLEGCATKPHEKQSLAKQASPY